MSEGGDLDPTLRRKLAALYGEPELPLDDAAQQRVVAAVQHESNRLARARRSRRTLLGFAGAGLLAAAAALIAWLGTRAHPHPVATRAEQLACALPFGSAEPRFARLEDGRQTLSLGVLGQLFAEAGSVVQLERSSACELSLRLEAGVLAGDLSNLRPAVLRIRTRLGEVVVRGTRFSVRADSALEVVLLSGTVDVLSPDHTTVHLSPGKLLRKTSTQEPASIAPALHEHEQRLDRLLAPEQVAPPPSTHDAAAGTSPRIDVKAAKTTAELLSAAEAARRRGRLVEARALYREAGGRGDENAEVALLRWARLELDSADAKAARSVLERYQQRFPHGRLSTEGAWLQVRALSAQGLQREAREAARSLIARFPNTPQAKAARQLLDAR
jgi:hypothetical protein